MILHILTAAALLLYCAALTGASRFYLHMLQLESYYLAGYRHHIFKKFLPLLAFLLPSCAAFIRAEWVAPAVLAASAIALYLLGKRMLNTAGSKKPLKVTGRIKRLLAAEFIVYAAISAGIGFACGFTAPCAAAAGLAVLLPFVAAVAVLMLMPIEYLSRKYYINDAKKRLERRPDLKIIGITGSYGKTSVKFILSSILSERYSVLTPPGNFNTTLGVVRVIRERLQSDDEVFICEMGSRHVGDIKEICDFVKPTVGIITSIGPQHLETFGSMERLVKGKFELIDALGTTGTAYFPAGNEYTEAMYAAAKCPKHLFGCTENCYISAQNITVSPEGSSFALVCQNGDSVFCTTQLLGRHNVQNIAGCAAIAYGLGMSLSEIARGISRIKPVEHRLQIVARYPITVIDDAYNSSPNGARAALDVLSGFGGRRIIITPGFVELGQKEQQFHYEYGKAIAACADIAVLVGEKRTADIKRGITDGGLAQSALYVVNTLDEASQLLRQIAAPGDTALFENDLPDNY